MNLVETGHSRAVRTHGSGPFVLSIKGSDKYNFKWGNNAELIIPLILFALMVDLSWASISDEEESVTSQFKTHFCLK